MNQNIKVGKYSMSSVGLGLWKIDNSFTANIVKKAIKIGYRHLDSAADYGNEKEVGMDIAYVKIFGLLQNFGIRFIPENMLELLAKDL